MNPYAIDLIELPEGDVDLLASEDYWDPHAIAGLLKSYLRELPASILTRDLHLRFLAVMGRESLFPRKTFADRCVL
jgi:hypothetical protein